MFVKSKFKQRDNQSIGAIYRVNSTTRAKGMSHRGSKSDVAGIESVYEALHSGASKVMSINGNEEGVSANANGSEVFIDRRSPQGEKLLLNDA